MHRRGFLRRAAGVTAAGALTGIRSAAALRAEEEAAAKPETHAIRLGAPVFEKADDPDAFARAHRALGYRGAYCPSIPLSDKERIRATREAFARQDVVIAEVGRWVNLLDADPEKRRKNFEFVAEGLALADEIGALCCVDIAGSFSREHWFGPHPDNLSKTFFDAAVENARKIIDEVQPKRAKFAYEMMGWALPDSADSYLEMLRAVDRKAFAAHLDPCNIVNSPARFYRSGALIDECFDKLGPWIVSCHAKDLSWEVEMNVHFKEVRPGTGELDYTTFLRRLAKLSHSPPLMIEHLPSAEEYDKARRHILGLGGELGLRFE
ncbi:MAG: sugar phosphate isomerase/epimerase [Planctomycetes bacterium]|nr:sugar phosphate isomerase/epimerase [Planctomycetota bacterium]